MEYMNPIIKNREVTLDNKIYTIKEIAVTRDDLMKIGKPFAETQKEESVFFKKSGVELDGVFIFKDKLNPNVGYRIYQEFNDYGFNGYGDDKLVAKLQEKQPLIKKSTFPTGIITLNDKIIGQEILLYLNHSEVHKYVQDNIDKLPTDCYIQILDILKEMYDNEIAYLDGHSKNFVVDRNSGHVEIIDFEWGRMAFDSMIKSSNWTIFNHLNALINRCNENSKVNDVLAKSNVQTFDEAYEYVKESEYKLIKSKRYCK